MRNALIRTPMLLVVAATLIGCGDQLSPSPNGGRYAARGAADTEVSDAPEPPPESEDDSQPAPGRDEGSKPDEGAQPRGENEPIEVPIKPDDPMPFPGAGSVESVSLPGWSSDRQDPLKRGVASDPLPEKLELVWTKDVPYGVPATCAIAGEHVFVPGLDGFLYCLKIADGEEVWKYRSNGEPDPEEFAPGFMAAPTVTGTVVFTGDEDGVVHAVDRKTGKKLWTHDTGGEVRGGPTICGENGESLLVASHGGGLYRLNAETGEREWGFEGIGPINLSPPLAGDRTFALGCETGDLVSVSITEGKELTRVPIGEAALATPAVMDGIAYFGTYEGRVLAIDYVEGDTAWTFQPKRSLEFHASCAVTDAFVFAAGRNKLLHCLNRDSGEEAWAFQAGAQINSSPVVVGNRVFFGCDDKHLYGVSIDGGEQVFKYNLEESVPAGPAVGGGVLIVGTEANPGAVYCFGKK